ncbi:MAG: helix-turn-helix domain-containing protein [Bosea sp.]|jgi:MerR family mercuric resistance operon transcriptional regulator|uniref:MerR family transcriptional regulator n=1 Tax=Bosea sp. (in: a-proteobacteria) TaxID=1871050 RepID=UPI002389E525|nr:helix-turn-helix domain-containing protein [Bosea sp. (in: a-proteobacteria)]MCP4738666.1 helix-turn-helix domain-containing protein [Bosea sp. (in: a-proteobacteria)]
MRGLTIGKLADLAGVNLETVRYYERIGLMPEPGRTAGGYRSYEDRHVRRLSFIRRSRELGFRIEEIKALLALAEPDQTSCAEVRALTMAHLDDVRAKIADLRRLESIIAETVDQCSRTNTPACPVLDMLSDSQS